MPQGEQVEQAMAERGVIFQSSSHRARQRATTWLRNPRCYWCGRETRWAPGDSSADAARIIDKYPPDHPRHGVGRYFSYMRVACQECSQLRDRLEVTTLRLARMPAPEVGEQEPRTARRQRLQLRLAELEQEWGKRRKRIAP